MNPSDTKKLYDNERYQISIKYFQLILTPQHTTKNAQFPEKLVNNISPQYYLTYTILKTSS